MKRSIRQIYDSIVNRPVFVTQNQVWRYMFYAGCVAGFMVGVMAGIIIGVVM